MTASETAPPPARPGGGRMLGLEALRGIAAICVVLLHLQATFGGHPKFFGKGYLGVDFFLMLSGYLMARTQETKLRAGLSAASFMVARYKRLWPMMALGGLLGAPTLYLRSESVAQFLLLAFPNFLLIPVSFQRLVFPLNIPAWTIFYELVANLLHVVLFWRFGRVALAFAIAVLLPVEIWIGTTFNSVDVGARPEHFFWGLPRITFAYLIGIALYRWWQDAPPAPVPPALAFVAMPVLCVTAWYLNWWTWQFDLAFVILACPLIMAGALRMKGTPAWARWSGLLSFPLFAVHMPILQAGAMAGLNWKLGGLLAFAGGIAAAVGSYRLRQRKLAGA